MKKETYTYIGYRDKFFCFENGENKPIRFSKVRSDIIHEFDLMNDTNLRQSMEVTYFITYEGDSEIRIISDIELK